MGRSRTSRRRSRTRRAFLPTSSVSSSPASSSRTAARCPTTTSRRSRPSTWCCACVVETKPCSSAEHAYTRCHLPLLAQIADLLTTTCVCGVLCSLALAAAALTVAADAVSPSSQVPGLGLGSFLGEQNKFLAHLTTQ